MSTKDIWSDDLLGRERDAEFVIDFLMGRYEERRTAGISGSYVLNINAEWGFGKSFFIERLARQLSQKHPTVVINAWKNDFSDDPYTMVVSEIDSVVSGLIPPRRSSNAEKARKALSVVRKNAGSILWSATKGAASTLSKKALGDVAEEIVDTVKAELGDGSAGSSAIVDAVTVGLDHVADGVTNASMEMLDALAQRAIKDYQTVKKSQDQFRESLAALLKAVDRVNRKQLPMFVFIDELDRCRPPYAVALLERIKHLFDVDEIIFVVATDTTQLSASINGLYGSSFDSRRYLQRFFTRTFSLPTPPPERLIHATIEATGTNSRKWSSFGFHPNHVEFLAQGSHHLGMSIREIQRALDVLTGLTAAWRYDFPIQLSIMYPLICRFVRQEPIDDWLSNKWFQELTVSLSDWVVRERTNSGGRSVEQNFRVRNLMNKFHEVAMKELREVYETDNNNSASDPLSRHVRQAADREFQNRILTREKPFSVMRDYPQMIKYAGHLTLVNTIELDSSSQ